MHSGPDLDQEGTFQLHPHYDRDGSCAYESYYTFPRVKFGILGIYRGKGEQVLQQVAIEHRKIKHILSPCFFRVNIYRGIHGEACTLNLSHLINWDWSTPFPHMGMC